MLKKIFSVLLAISLIFSVAVLGGCGDSKKNVDPSEKTVVTVWTGEGSSKAKMESLVDEFNKTIGEEKGIEIEYSVHGGDMATALDSALKNGNAPDLFAMGGDGYAYVRKNYLMALEDLKGGQEILKRYEGRLVEDRDVINGKTYKLPFKATVYGMVYNKALFKKAGIVDENGEALPPVTYDQWIEYSKKISALGDDIYGTILPVKWSGFFGTEILNPSQASFGYINFSKEKGKYDFIHLKPVFEKLIELKKSDSVFPGAEGLDNDAARAQFAQGNIGMKMAASWDVGVLKDQFTADFDWGVAPVPVLDENERYKEYVSVATFVYINADIPEEKQEKVALVYDWFYSDDVAIELYEEGFYMPPNPAIIEKADLTNSPQQWKSFGEIVEISDATTKPVLGFDIGTEFKYEGTNVTTIYQQIWDESISVDEGLSYLEKMHNEALDRALDKTKIDRNTLGYKTDKY